MLGSRLKELRLGEMIRENVQTVLQVVTVVVALASAYVGMMVKSNIADLRVLVAEQYQTKKEARETHLDILEAVDRLRQRQQR